MKQFPRPKPVVILTGYLGSGKTTVMNRLLQNAGGARFALIVNDVGSINIDASLLRSGQTAAWHGDLVELQNGCICCTLREQFMVEVERLAQLDSLDAILVEASGVSDPASLAQAFLLYQEEKQIHSFYLSKIVSVADADRIAQEFLGGLESRAGAESQADEDPDIINLIMDQIEFCSLILLNKCDLLSQEQLDRVKETLQRLQQDAPIFETVEGRIDPALLLDARPFDYDRVNRSSLLSRALEDPQAVGGAEYGIQTFVFQARKPLDRARFSAFVGERYPEAVIRAKGYLWFSDDAMHVQLFEQAGRNASITEVSNWVAALPEADRREVFENYPETRSDWDEEYGDRLNQLVLIAQGDVKSEVLSALESCLAEKETE